MEVIRHERKQAHRGGKRDEHKPPYIPQQLPWHPLLPWVFIFRRPGIPVPDEHADKEHREKRHLEGKP